MGMTPGVAVNGRFYSHRPTGMQRYAIEVSRRLGASVDCLRPSKPMAGIKGHLWEQFYLPAAVKGRLLWSPNDTGPLAVSNQVCTFHDMIPLDHPEWFNKRFADWYGWLLPRLARKVRHIIANSTYTKKRVLELCGIGEDRVTVIPLGVDPRFRRQPAEAVEQMRQKIGLPGREYVLYLGSLEPRKNMAGLLAAWSKVQDSLPEDLQLVIAGAKGKPGVFAQVYPETLPPRVHFTGYVDDELLPALYSGAMAVVYPSLYEGFGFPPLEAMACGVPVVTSNTTSLPEVTGGAAMLVNPTDTGAIASAIEALAKSAGLRDRMGRQGCDWARQFCWDRAAKRTWEVLEAYA